MSQGKKFKDTLKKENPLQIAGTLNAFCALLAKDAGFLSIYLSGSGVAASAFGLPDLGLTSRTEVVEEARRLTQRVDLPLLVDVDTGWGSYFNIARTVSELIQAGAAALHIEDQIDAKRCGHRPGKQLTDVDNMVDRIHAAVDARTDPDFVIMARTDALATEGLEAALERVMRYVEAGADMIFFEGARCLEDYAIITKACSVPVLANSTEFGVTPLFSLSELKNAGVQMVLYPLSAFRAMSQAALSVYQSIRVEGSQKEVLPLMQTREQLYQLLDYHRFEKKLDAILQKDVP